MQPGKCYIFQSSLLIWDFTSRVIHYLNQSKVRRILGKSVPYIVLKKGYLEEKSYPVIHDAKIKTTFPINQA